MIYKVLIVDDENNIREGLKRIIDWEEYGIEIIGAASNGVEALQMIEEFRPKFMITDIKMPFMDGIELIKAIHKKKYNMKIIVLSGYDDFMYVKEAMKYGAENYILKPINKDELENSVKEIIEGIENKAFIGIQKQETTMILKNNVLNRIIKNEIPLREMKERLELLKININSKHMHIAVIESIYLGKDKIDKKDYSDYWTNFGAFNICEEIIGRNKAGEVFLDGIGNIVVIFNQFHKMDIHKEIEQLLEECVHCIKHYIGLDSIAGVSAVAMSHRQLHIAYVQALKSLDYKFVLVDKEIIFFEHIVQYKQKNDEDLIDRFSQLEDYIRQGDKDKISTYINQVYEEIITDNLNIAPALIKSNAAEIMMIVFNLAIEYKVDKAKLTELKYVNFNYLLNSQDINALKQNILKAIIEVVELIEQIQSKKFSKVINYVVNYIQTYYSSQDISLKTLSNEMNLNASYLGRTFKAETGVYFTDYLNEIRVEKAKELLLSTNLKANVISIQVGFSNNNYFYAIFKKHIGISPGEFR